MTAALNYTPKAVADLMTAAYPPGLSAGDQACSRWLAALLQRAAVFILPDGGCLLDCEKPRPEVPHSTFRPPFPVVAIEYRAAPNDFEHEVYAAETSTRRIALAWEAEDKNGVLVASVSYYDQRRAWLPPLVAAFLSYDGGYRLNDDPNEFQRAMIEQGQIAPAVQRAPALQLAGWLPLMPDMFAAVVNRLGLEQALLCCAADNQAEFGAYVDLCLALACTNVSVEHHAAPTRLNKERIKADKPPLKDFHVLHIGGTVGTGFGAEEGGGGLRSHLRRGHIRRLGPERITWVNSCMVRGSKPGFVRKHYAVEKAA